MIVLAIGISGIEQLGGEFWVEPFFNGTTLIVAIGIAAYTQRRRVSAQYFAQTAAHRDAMALRESQAGKVNMKNASLLAATAVVALAATGGARADDIMATAKARIAAATQRAGAWDGPTTGPTAAPNKTIVYVAGDLRNGGTSGVADGVKEATAAIGWKAPSHRRPGPGFYAHGGPQSGYRPETGRHSRLRIRRDRAERRAGFGEGGRHSVRRLARDHRARPGSGDGHVL